MRARCAPARIERLLGERIAADEAVAASSSGSGFELADAGRRALDVRCPSWRDGDVQREADLIEEVARIHGLDKLPTTLPARRAGRRAADRRASALRRRLEDLLRDRGLLETISYSFTSPRDARARCASDDEPLLRLENPLSEDQSVMRPLLLPGLLDAARHNAAHGRAGVALFESAHVYLPAGPLEPAPDGSPGGRDARRTSATTSRALLTEARARRLAHARRAPADFYARKALLEALLEAAGRRAGACGARRAAPFLHPGPRGAVVAGEASELGWIGELHPLVARAWELDGPVAAFELDAGRCCRAGRRARRDATAT